MKMSFKVPGEEHPDTLNSMHDLETKVLETTSAKEKPKIQAMKMIRKIPGEEHPDKPTGM